MDRSDNPNDRDNPTGGTGPGRSSDGTGNWRDDALPAGAGKAESAADPSARNPKDEGKVSEVIQAAEVRRRHELSVRPTGAALVSGFSAGQPQHPQAGPAAMDLLVSILRFKWTILIIWILVSTPIIAAVWTQVVPTYQAKAEIRVRPIIPRLVFKTDENGQIPFYESFVNTQVSFVRNPTVLQRVLDLPEVQQTRWYRDPPQSLMGRFRGGTVPPLERLRDNLSARPRLRTEIIDVSFTDVSANDAKIIVNAVIDQYMGYMQDAAGQDQRELDRQLTDEYNKLNSDISTQENIRVGYCKILQTDSPQELISGKRVRLDETRARLNALRIRIGVLEQELKQMAVSDSNRTAVVGDSNQPQPKYYADAEWRKLDLDVQMAQHEIDNSILRDPNHPERLRLRRNLEFAKKLLRTREQQLDEQWGDRPPSALAATVTSPTAGQINYGPPLVTSPMAGQIDYGITLLSPKYQLAGAQQEEQLLTADLSTQQDEFTKLFDTAQKLEEVSTNLRHKREVFDAVRQRLDQRNMERGVAGSIEILTRALTPSTPSQDRRVVLTAMGLFVGLGLGGGLAFLRASRNQTIYAPKDMPQPAQAPFLGYMPLVNLRKPLGEALCEEIGQKQALLVESVRVLRTTLLSRLNAQGSTTVLVTSANEGTGKSSFATMLGRSIAQAGRKVLLIDADLHKMGLSKRFKVSDKPGLRESLKDKAAEGLHVFPTETAGLDIMPAGQRVNGDIAFEEIANGAFNSCISRLFERYGYDMILLDTPPILPVADAAILAGQVDATILVEREHVSRRTEVANALVRLGSAGGHLIGTVFVGSAEQNHYGYGYSYGHYGSRTKDS